MVTRDWAAIRKVIRKGAKIACKYLDAHGNTCVLGGLAVAAHIRLPARDRLSEHITCFPMLVKKLTEVYGINAADMGSLQDINDSHANIRDRRKALLEEVSRLESLYKLDDVRT